MFVNIKKKCIQVPSMTDYQARMILSKDYETKKGMNQFDLDINKGLELNLDF